VDERICTEHLGVGPDGFLMTFKGQTTMTVAAGQSGKGKGKSAAIAARAAKSAAKRNAKVIKLSDARKAKIAPPTPYQQEALIVKYRLKARKLGRSILRRWHARMDLDEVDSIVDLSLCEAVKRFDPAKGASFMTFLFYHLKGNLVRAVTSAATSNSIPVYNSDELETQVGEPDHLFGHQFRAMNSAEVAEAVASQDTPLPDEVLWRKELHSQSTLACEKLDPLEREIIKRIFLQEQQIMEIAATLGYSRCHISRVKKKALETLYNELTGTMSDIDLGKKPSFDDDGEEEVKLKIVGRRPVYRRRPRAKGPRPERLLTAKAA
jgi:RNA polymerase sigma factor (sigma-70 family)